MCGSCLCSIPCSCKRQSSCLLVSQIFVHRVIRVVKPIQGKGYLANVKDPLRVRDILGTKLMLGHQSLHIVVELHNAAIVLDPDDDAMCL